MISIIIDEETRLGEVKQFEIKLTLSGRADLNPGQLVSILWAISTINNIKETALIVCKVG